MENIDKVINEAVNKAISERGAISVLIAGRSGVGKSTLINSVFQKNMAATGQGRPVTQNTREITKEGVPLTIFDTRGLEMARFKDTLTELEALITQRKTDRDTNRHIHVAWLCIQEDGRRVEDAESDLCKMLSRYMPVVVVITKARSDGGFRQEVQNLLSDAKNVIRVRAIREQDDDGIVKDPMGLRELIDITSEVIPEGKRIALAAAQKADLKYKQDVSEKAVVAATTFSVAAGATPIPFSDAFVLAPIQITMLASITATFGLDLSKATLSTILASGLGVGGATLVGRTIVVNLLKFIPGGNVAGMAISATTAGALTSALGYAYIKVLSELLSENPDANPSGSEIGERLKVMLKKSEGAVKAV